MNDELNKEILKKVIANTENTLNSIYSCCNDALNDSYKALNYVASELDTILNLYDYESTATQADFSFDVYQNNSKHYANDEINTLALLAICALCKVQLLQKQDIISLSTLNSVYEVLNRVDNGHKGKNYDES